jgi:hypothetical protein
MRKAVLFVMLMSAPILSGCSWVGDLFTSNDQPQRAEADRQRLDQMTRETDACVAKAGKTRVETSMCVNRAFQSAMFDINYPYPDIVASLSAERLRVAEQIDLGQISQAEGLARISDKLSEVIRLERARNATAAGKTEAAPPQYFLQIMQAGL